MAATTTVAESTTDTPEVDSKAPVNVVAIIAVAIGVLALVAFLVPGSAVLVPALSVLGIVVASVGLALAHRIQDRVGGSGGYWFAIVGLLAGILGLYISLAVFTSSGR